MTTYYVSKSTANGWAVGVDTNNGTSTATPFLTLEKALNAMGAGDTCIVNDGTYTYNVAADPTSTGYWKFQNSGQTVKPLNDYAVTLKPAAGQGTGFLQNRGGAANTLGAFKFDASGMGNNASVIYANSSVNWGDESRGINGPWVVNTGAANTGAAFWDGNTIGDTHAYNIRVDNGFGKGAVYAPIISTGSLDINGLTGSVTNVTVDRCGALYAAGTTTNAGWVRVRGCSMTVSSSASGLSGVLNASNIQYIFENNHGMVFSGTCPNGAVVAAPPISATVQADNSICRWNSGTNSAPGHYLFVHGTDGGSANDNTQNYPIVHDNDFTYTGSDTLPHGYVLGSVKGGVVCDNVATGAAIPFLSKLQSERAYFVKNKVCNLGVYSGASALYCKGSIATFASNLVPMDASNHALFMASNIGDATTATATFVGNILQADAGYAVTLAVVVGSGADASTGVFVGNDYYMPGGVSGTPFSYGATTYATRALWSAAHELNYEGRMTAASGRVSSTLWESNESNANWMIGGIEGALIAQSGRL